MNQRGIRSVRPDHLTRFSALALCEYLTWFSVIQKKMEVDIELKRPSLNSRLESQFCNVILFQKKFRDFIPTIVKRKRIRNVLAIELQRNLFIGPYRLIVFVGDA